ncbi:MAG: lysoplasmalogenase [Anaerolineales bacterium]
MHLSFVRFGLSLAAVVSAILSVMAWYALHRRVWLFFILKPLTTCLILAVALLPFARTWSTYGGAVVLGLLFSLFGDILLMLPADRFLAGLGSFLLTHLSYIFAFATAARYAGFPWISIPLVFIGALILWYLWAGLPPRLRGPLAAYVLVIVTMASLAVYRAALFPRVGTIAAGVGAVLFLSSDAVLAIDRFRRPFRAAQAVVLGTYFAGQLLIALSVSI